MTNEANNAWEKTFRDVMDVWITPEVIKRQEQGRLPKPLSLRQAQVLFYPDSRPTQVRINDEVRALAKVKLRDASRKNPRDLALEHEIEAFEALKLSDDDDSDCGHITIIKLRDTWYIFFDFIYNKQQCQIHLNAAREFYDVARFSVESAAWRSFVDNAFSAAELAAKALLLTMARSYIKEQASHKHIHSQFNRFARLGNVDPKQRDTFNRLRELRPRARYLQDDFDMDHSVAVEILDAIVALIERTEAMTRAEAC